MSIFVPAMSLYNILIKPFVQKMSTERASRVGLRYFQLIGRIPLARAFNRWIHPNKSDGLQSEVFGLQFYNPVGLGAGLDLRGELYNDLNNLGFSFSEIGPIVNAEGTRKAINNVQKDPQDDLLSICISGDYLTSFTLSYDFFDFFVIDMSSSSVDTGIIDDILEVRLGEQNYKPIVIKVSERISPTELERLSDYCMMNSVDGLELRSLEQVERVSKRSKGRLPIIANCHTDTPQRALEALIRGASLVEIRTALLHEGPGIVTDTLKLIRKSKEEHEAGKRARENSPAA